MWLVEESFGTLVIGVSARFTPIPNLRLGTGEMCRITAGAGKKSRFQSFPRSFHRPGRDPSRAPEGHKHADRRCTPSSCQALVRGAAPRAGAVAQAAVRLRFLEHGFLRADFFRAKVSLHCSAKKERLCRVWLRGDSAHHGRPIWAKPRDEALLPVRPTGQSLKKRPA